MESRASRMSLSAPGAEPRLAAGRRVNTLVLAGDRDSGVGDGVTNLNVKGDALHGHRAHTVVEAELCVVRGVAKIMQCK